MRDMIIDLERDNCTWKVQLTIAVNFIFSKDIDEGCVMHLKSGNKELQTYDNVNDIVDKLFKTLFKWFQNMNKRE